MHQKKYRALPSPRFTRVLAALLFVLCFSADLFSQGITSSPYSRYGLGDVQERAFAPQAGMAGIGYAVLNDSTSPYFINCLNPATYTGIRITTFDAGVRSNTYKLQSNASEAIVNNTSLGYVALGFPLGKRGGASFGLLPYSSVGYNITDSDTNGFGERENFGYEGSGGLNQFYMGAGMKLLPSRFAKKGTDLSFGINGSYIFGTINNKRSVYYNAPNHYNTRINESTTIGDFTADLGLLFSFTKDSTGRSGSEDTKFLFGITCGLPSSLSATRTQLINSYTVSSLGFEQFVDTIVNNQGVEGSISLPLSFGAGIAVKQGERLLVGLDYSMQQWSKLTLFEETAELNNSMKLALGMQFVPKKNMDTKDSYFKRIHYRAGVQYRQTFLELRSTQLTETSVSVGFGLPLRLVKVGAQYSHSMVNFSIEAGQRGTIENNLIKEQFVRGLVSFTLNDRWFIKRKFD
jgi:hypothetical protein